MQPSKSSWLDKMHQIRSSILISHTLGLTLKKHSTIRFRLSPDQWRRTPLISNECKLITFRRVIRPCLLGSDGTRNMWACEGVLHLNWLDKQRDHPTSVVDLVSFRKRLFYILKEYHDGKPIPDEEAWWMLFLNLKHPKETEFWTQVHFTR